MAGSDLQTLDDHIVRATHELLVDPDWQENLQLCDIVNRFPDLGGEVANRVLKRLGHKKTKVATLSLTLLETLMKNCPTIHKHVGNRDFMNAYVKTLPKKIRDPQKKGVFSGGAINDVNELERIDRTLLLIQSWAKAFSKSQSYPVFREVYEELADKGIKFPEPEKDELAPVFTPAPKSASHKSDSKTSTPANNKPAADKFKDPDCRAAAESATVLEEMVTASEIGTDLARSDLVQTLVANSRALQARIMTRLNNPVSETVLADILAANDVVNNALNYYQGVATGTLQRKKPEPPPSAAADKPDEKKKHKKEKEAKPQAIAPPAAGGGGGGTNLLDFDFSGSAAPAAAASVDSHKKKDKHSSSSHSHSSHSSKSHEVPKLNPPDSPFSLAPPSEGSHGHRTKSPDKHRSGTVSARAAPSPAAASPAQPTMNLFDFDPLSISSSAPAAAAPKSAAAAPGGDFDEFMMLALRGKDEPAAAAPAKKKPVSIDDLDEFDKLALR